MNDNAAPTRRPLAETSSHAIAIVADGVLRKDLSNAALTPGGRATRRHGLHDPAREPAVYRSVLTPASIGPRCFASGDDWIEIEHLSAVPLWQAGDPATWVAVAAWLGDFHSRMTQVVAAALPEVPLIDYSQSMLDHSAPAARTVADGSIAVAHRRAVARLAEAPVTLVHGDLYASNVLVAGAAPHVAVYPIDWELAGRGAGELDVAALTVGDGLPAATVADMEDAYAEQRGIRLDERAAWSQLLDSARLHVCMQWSARPAGWRAPRSHRHDWAAAARWWAERC